MRKTVFVAVALATVYLGVTTPKTSAQDMSVTTSHKTVKNLLLADGGKATQDKDSAPAGAAKPTPSQTTPTPIIITVQPGDSLSSIAEANSTTWVRLYNANDTIVNPNIINPGDQLRIPTPDEPLVDRALPQPVVVAPVQTPRPTSYRAPAPVTNYPTDPNSAKAFIYSRESGNNPNATNPNGCYGIGQDCNGRVRSSCGADYACQDAYFSNYATNRYGSWEAAQAFWQSHGWW